MAKVVPCKRNNSNQKKEVKNGIPITDNSGRHTMKLENILHIQWGNLNSSIRVRNRNEVDIFGQPIHYHQNHLKPLWIRQTFNEIQTYINPRIGRNFQGLKQTSWCISFWFNLLTRITLPNKPHDVRLHTIPIELPLGSLIGFENPEWPA